MTASGSLWDLIVFYPTLWWNYLLGKVLRLRPWYTEIDDVVILGAYPIASDIIELKKKGLTGVINMCKECTGPVECYTKEEIETLHLATVDFEPPTFEACLQGVAFLEKHAQQGGRVYVHCKAGRGRSATIVLCWLMKKEGISPEEGQALLLKKRGHVNTHLAKRKAVLEFYQKEATTQ